MVHNLKQCSLDDFWVFGCLVYYRVLSPSKSEAKARPGILLGVNTSGMDGTYIIRDPELQSIFARYKLDDNRRCV